MGRYRYYDILVVVSLLATFLLSSAGFCCYSGLLVIPTAYTVGNGQYSYEYQTDGVIQGMTADARLFNNQIGIGKRLELGADFDLGTDATSRVFGNAKCVAYESGSGNLAAAVGIANVADHWKSAPYLVTSATLGGTNLHVGTMRIDGSNRCILGIDRAFGKLTLMGDYTSGSDVVSSVGFNYQLRENFGVMAGALLPRGGEDTGFTLHLVWCQSLGSARGKE